MAGLVENKANSARPAELELAASWGLAALGKKKLSLVAIDEPPPHNQKMIGLKF